MKFYDGFLSYLQDKRANTAHQQQQFFFIILGLSSRDEKHCQILNVSFDVITAIETYVPQKLYLRKEVLRQGAAPWHPRFHQSCCSKGAVQC